MMSFPFPPTGKVKEKIQGIYWCVAYLPSEASIIEHWTYTFHYQISYTFIKQCETLNTSRGIEFNVL
jgi:hypothetical protein